MDISKISSKGQVTIPKSIRELLELDAGDRIIFIEENGRAYITKASLAALNHFHQTINRDAASKGISAKEMEERQDSEREDFWSRRRAGSEK